MANLIKRFFTAVALAAACNNASASGIPTVDIANILQTTVSALENIEQTVNQIESIRNQVEQIGQLDRQFEQITGSYNMGQILNSAIDRNIRRHVPRTWQETLAILEAGGLPGYQTEAQEAAQDAREAGEKYTSTDLYEDDSLARAQEYIRDAHRVFAAMGASQSVYNSTEQRYENIEQLTDQIDVAPNIKAAADLQNRLLAENAAYANELIRQVAVLNIQQSEMREKEHNRRAVDSKMARVNLTYDY